MRDEGRGGGAFDGRFEVPGEAAASPEPGERPFDDPAAREHDEALGGIGPFDDLDVPAAEAGEPSRQLRTSKATVGENVTQPGIEGTDRREDADGVVAILDIGRMDLHADQMTGRVGDYEALAPLDLLARVVAARAAPPA